ncbi:MAG: N-acetylmuramoyl-L-alanine amidase [Bacteroidota bacterium]
MKTPVIKGIPLNLSLLSFIFFFGFSETILAQEGIRTIVIDAGHGGHDAGNLGTGRYKKTEKDVALEVALKVGEYIKEAFPEIKIIYTRKDDRFIQLGERANIANRNHADLFISIHCNAAKAVQAAGTETWVMGLHVSKANLDVAMRENSVILLEDNYQNTYADFNPRDPDSYIAMSLMQSAYLEQSLSLASKVQEDFTKKVGRHNRGIKQAGFLVLYKTAMPAILIELGFLTNAAEEDYLQSSEGKVYMASSIFRAFRTYKEATESIYGKSAEKPEKEKEPEKPIGKMPPRTQEKEVISESKGEEDKKESIKIAHQDVEKQVVEKLTPKSDNSNSSKSEILFKVQFLTSPQKIAGGSPRFKGLDQVEPGKSNGSYKYTTGKFENYKDAKVKLEEVKAKFPSAFIVAFKDNEPIAVQEAIKQASR